jgi:hypothetical protein
VQKKSSHHLITSRPVVPCSSQSSLRVAGQACEFPFGLKLDRFVFWSIFVRQRSQATVLAASRFSTPARKISSMSSEAGTGIGIGGTAALSAQEKVDSPLAWDTIG